MDFTARNFFCVFKKKKCSHSLFGKIHKKLSGMNGPESPHFTAGIS